MGSDYYNSLNTYGTSSTASLDSMGTAYATFLVTFFGIILLAVIVIAILQIIGMWKVFTKAGEKGWKSLIPFYNMAILYKISGMSPYLVFVYIALLIPIVNWFAGIALSAIGLYQKINLMKAFRASTGLSVAMIMVPFVTYLILGFGKSQYYGVEEKAN